MKTETFVVVEIANEESAEASVNSASIVYLGLESGTIPWAGHAILVHARNKGLAIPKDEKIFRSSSVAKTKTMCGRTIIACRASRIIVEPIIDTL